MGEHPDEEQRDEDGSAAANSNDDEEIDDPLTRTDVDASRKPLGSSSGSE